MCKKFIGKLPLSENERGRSQRRLGEPSQVTQFWLFWRRKGKKNLRLRCSSKKILVRPTGSPQASVDHQSPVSPRNEPAAFSHWLRVACEKHGVGGITVMDSWCNTWDCQLFAIPMVRDWESHLNGSHIWISSFSDLLTLPINFYHPRFCFPI